MDLHPPDHSTSVALPAAVRPVVAVGHHGSRVQAAYRLAPRAQSSKGGGSRGGVERES